MSFFWRLLFLFAIIQLINGTQKEFQAFTYDFLIKYMSEYFNLKMLSEFGQTRKSHHLFSQNEIDLNTNETILEIQKIIDDSCSEGIECILSGALDIYPNIRWNKIKFMDKIVRLDLRYNKITNLNGIKFPKNLIDLQLKGNNIKSLNGIQFPTKLRDLNLKYNQIKSLNNVQFPSSLRVLYLDYNKIKLLNDVKFPNLMLLSMHYNEIEKLDDVRFPQTLRLLDLEHNQIKSVKNVSGPLDPYSYVCSFKHNPIHESDIFFNFSNKDL